MKTAAPTALSVPDAPGLPMFPAVWSVGGAREPQRDLGKALEAVAEIGRRAISSSEAPVVMLDAAEFIAGMLDTEYGGVAESSEDGKSIQLTVLLGLREEELRWTQSHTTPREEGGSLAAQTMLTARPIVIENLGAEERFHDPFLQRLGIQSVLSVPLLISGNCAFGVLAAYSNRRRRFSRENLFLAETIAHLVALAIVRRRAEDRLAQQCQSVPAIQSSAIDLERGLPLNLELAGLASATPGNANAANDVAPTVQPANPPPRGGNRRRQLRRPYPYQQMMAPIVSGKLPKPHDFGPVYCSDISTKGLAFLSPTAPSAKEYVIALGHAPSLIYLRLRVVHATCLPKQEGYVVGCTFTGRADG